MNGRKFPFTPKKEKWLSSREIVLRGNTLNYNAAQQMRYSRSIVKLVNEMTLEVKNKITKLFNGQIADEYFEEQEKASAMDASISSKAKILLNALMDKFDQLFSKKSKELSDTMVTASAKSSENNLHASLKQLSGGLSLKTGIVPKGMEDVATAIIAENVSLIKSIPAQYFKDITGSVMRSITTGNGLADLIPDMQKYEGQTKRRARNLALDQTRKAYNSINKQRMQAVGVKQFEWIHSAGGQAPRESHIKISGHIFSFENLEAEQAALGVPVQDRGIPGQPINCKCRMKPVIDFSGE